MPLTYPPSYIKTHTHKLHTHPQQSPYNCHSPQPSALPLSLVIIMPKRKTSPPPSHTSAASSPSVQQAPSYVVAAPTSEGLPDIALALVVEHLKTGLIKGLQLINRWAFSYFAPDIQELVLLSYHVGVEDPPPTDTNHNQEAYHEWVVKYTTQLGSSLSRFPKLSILKADPNDEHLGAVLVKVFQRQTFPTVQRFQSLHKDFPSGCCIRLPARLLITGLPALVAIDFGYRRLQWNDREDVDAVLKGLADGTAFPRLQELSLDEFYHRPYFPFQGRPKSQIHKVTDALKAREALGTCPALTDLRIRSKFSEDYPSDSAQAMRELLSLQCCSKLRSFMLISRHPR